MKKTLFILLTLIAFSLVGCDIIDITNEKSSQIYSAPDIVKVTKENAIPLTIAVPKGTEYLNVFRSQLVSGAADGKIDTKVPVVNVGEIYLVDKNIRSVTFYDYFTSIEKNYRYAVRYKFETEYAETSLSKQVSGAVNGTNPEKMIILPEETASIPVTFNETQCILTIPENAFQLPAETSIPNVTKFDVMVSLNNGSRTLLFNLTHDTGNHLYSLSIRPALPDYFFDKQLKVQYIVGQIKTSYNEPADTVLYYNLNWTLPCTAKLIGPDGKGLDHFTVLKEINTENTADFTPPGNRSANISSEKNYIDVTENSFFADFNF